MERLDIEKMGTEVIKFKLESLKELRPCFSISGYLNSDDPTLVTPGTFLGAILTINAYEEELAWRGTHGPRPGLHTAAPEAQKGGE